MIGMGFSNILVLLVFTFGGQTGLPLGLPPGPEDPVMSQFAPEDCQFYTSWSSTVAPDPEGSPTERWMADPEIQNSFRQLKDAIKQLTETGSDQDRAFGKLAFEVAERCLTNACGFYCSKIEFQDFSLRVEGGALIHLGDDADQLATKINEQIIPLLAKEGIKAKAVDIDSQKFQSVTLENRPDVINEFTWGVVDGKYLAIAFGVDEMSRLIANMKSDAPAWLTTLKDEIAVDRTSATTWVNLESVLELIEAQGVNEEFERVFEVMGFNQLKSMGWIAGLDDDGFICRGQLRVDGPPKGVLGLFGSEGLEPEMFGRIANDRMVMTGIEISAPRIFALIRDMTDINVRSRGQFDQTIGFMNTELGFDIEEDIINVLDEHAYVYGSVNFANPTAGWVLGIGASNELELTETYNTFNEFFEGNVAGVDGIEFEESEVNGSTIYGIKDTRGWGTPNFSWTLADGELLISMDKSSIRRHLRREPMADDALANDSWFVDNSFSPPRMDAEGPLMVASLDISALLTMGVPLLSTFGDRAFPPEFGFSFDDLPALKLLTKDMKPSLTSLYRTPECFETVQRQTYPGGTPGTFLGTAAIGVLPATLQVRRAAMRTDGANRMRQLILAMHNYHDSTRAFPARFSKNDDDEPLLSWRVHILPYLEENDLYEQFRLDEPWDSDHNKTLVEKMPDCYFHPMAKPEEGKTVFVVPTGEGAMPDPEASGAPQGMRLEAIVDGTSRTGVIFETSAEKAVVWSKPDDFDWENIEDPVAALFAGWEGEGINVAFADGSVQHITREKLTEILEKLIKTNDGEVFEWDE